MKVFAGLLTTLFLTTAAMAGTIRITVAGNQEVQAVIDGITYNPSNFVNDEVVVGNLSEGNHSVVIYKVNRRGRSKQLYSSNVRLEENSDIRLTITANGGITREELSSNEAWGSRTIMSEAAFTTVYNKINAQRGQAARLSAARNAIANRSDYFSTDQVLTLLELFNTEAGRLEVAKLSYTKLADPENVNRFYAMLNSQASRNELDNFVRQQTYGNTGNSYRVAMTTSAFNQLYQNILSRSSATSRSGALTAAFNSPSNYFNVDQVVQLVNLGSGESQKLQLIKLSLDNIVDASSMEKLFGLLYMQSSKEDLDRYIRNNGYGSGNYSYATKTAMSESSFNTIYSGIQRKWLPGAKFSAASDAFNNSSNNFTVAQAAQIIELLSSESNRLQLAKIAFDNIVDVQNFRQIYDLLPTQAVRDELDDYLRRNHNYKY